MFGLTVSFAESLWHCDFVEVPKCSFAKNYGGSRGFIKFIVNINM
jgi:hypothetical protein